MNISELLDLCIKVNNETKANIFLDYSGHIDAIRVCVQPNGWLDDEDLIEKYIELKPEIKFELWRKKYDVKNRFTIYVTENRFDENKYNEIIEYLNSLLVN